MLWPGNNCLLNILNLPVTRWIMLTRKLATKYVQLCTRSSLECSLIGNGGDSPNGSGGMIPSTAPPFAMTRWVAQTRQNYVSVTPYNHTDDTIHGFQGTHQPAIWMGESAQAIVIPGTGKVQSVFADRGMKFSHEDEVISPSYYSAILHPESGGTIHAEQSASEFYSLACYIDLIRLLASRVGHLQFTFTDTQQPHIIIEASRASVMGSDDPTNVTYPLGSISISTTRREVTGHNEERQDFIIGPNAAPGFAGYFCARFSEPFEEWGVSSNANGTLFPGESSRNGSQISGYVLFDQNVKTVEVRIGVSFISVEQARENLDSEIPDGTSLTATARTVREAWAEKLDRIQIEGAGDDAQTIFYTAVFHTLQVRLQGLYTQGRSLTYVMTTSTHTNRMRVVDITPDMTMPFTKAYHTLDIRSGYLSPLLHRVSPHAQCQQDTYRATWAWQILLAPERINGMVQSILQDFKEVYSNEYRFHRP